MGGLRHRQYLQPGAFLLDAEVALLIDGGAANERGVDGEWLVEEPLPASQLDDLDEVFVGDVVQAATLLARINEGVQPDVRDETGAAGGDFAEHLGHHALRKVVGLEAALQRHPPHFRGHGPIAGHDPLDQPLQRNLAEATLRLVADAGAVDEGQVVRAARLQKVLAQAAQQQVGFRRPPPEPSTTSVPCSGIIAAASTALRIGLRMGV